MFKPSKNPKVEELTKSWTRRNIPVQNLNLVKHEDGTKGCVWCGEPLASKHHAARYCTDDNCRISAYAWARPQGEEGIFFIMMRQDWQCNICKYDWKPFIETKIINKFYGTHDLDYKNKFSMYFVRRLKENIDPKLKPEVDHIVPIYKGGQSIGLENCQIICYSCHKGKTSKDLTKEKK